MATTGNDLLAYQGNAALAVGGANNGGGFLDNGGSILAKEANEIIDIAGRNQLMSNSRKYEQAIKDRDAIYEQFAKTDLDFPVEDIDRPELQAKIDSVKKKMIETPNLRANREKWLEVQKDLNELTAMKASAKTRSAIAADQRIAAAKEINPMKKKEMMESLDTQLNKGVYHQIDPYSKLVEWDEKTLAPISYTKTLERSVRNGVPYVTEIETPMLQGWRNHYSIESLAQGKNQNLPFAIRDWNIQQETNPELFSPENVKKVNARIDAINAEQKLTGDDILPHFGEVGADGKVTMNPNPTTRMMLWDVAGRYVTKRGAEKIDEDFLKGKKMQSEAYENMAQGDAARTNAAGAMIQAKARAQEVNDNSKLIPSRIKLLEAQAKQAEASGDKAQAETLRMQSNGASNVRDAVQMFTNIVRDANGFSTQIKLPQNALANLQGLGLPAGATYKELGRGNETAVKMLSMVAELGSKTEGTPMVLDKPTRIYAVKIPGNANSVRVMGVYKDGQTRMVDPNEGWQRLAIFNNGFEQNDKLNDVLTGGTAVIREMQGSDATSLDLGAIESGQAPVVDNSAAGTTIQTFNLNGDSYSIQGRNAYDASGTLFGVLNSAGDLIDVNTKEVLYPAAKFRRASK